MTKEARGNTNEVAWSTISTTAACENNREGITRVSFYESAQTLEVCQTMCQDRHDCMAIDYYAESGWCNLYDDVCTSPMRSEQGSSSYALKRGNGVAAILVFFVNFAEAASNEAMAELERQIRQLPRLKKGSVHGRIVHACLHAARVPPTPPTPTPPTPPTPRTMLPACREKLCARALVRV